MARRKGFETLTNIDEALSKFFGKLQLKKMGVERVSIRMALGRVIAEDIRAKKPLPPFDRSAVDGYAVRARDTFEATQFTPKILNLTENEVQENEAKPIWTGNPLTRGANAVVMQEYTRGNQNEIEVWTSITPGRNVSRRGEDVQKGETAIKAGTRLKPHHCGLLAALEATYVKVVRKPKVGILSTGNELIEVGNTVNSNQIINSNSVILSGMCQELGADTINLGVVRDNVKEISSKIRAGVNNADVIITTGGTSVGHHDLVPTAINQMDEGQVIVHGIAMRPGMPTALAILQNKPVLILPGNPVAAIMGFEVFSRPLLLMLLGVDGETRPQLKAKLTQRVASALGRRVFLRVKVYRKETEFYAEPIRIKGSGIISTMTKANGYVVIPENREGVEQGESVIVYLFDNLEGTKSV